MPLATTQQYADMIDRAAEGGYALAAVNVTSSETLNAALRGFAQARADGIVQYTPGAAEHMSGAAVRNAAVGACAVAHLVHAIAAASPVLVALHSDHCPPSRVDDWLRPLRAESARRVAAGQAPAGNVILRPEILRAGQDALVQAHPGARFHYVFDGSSGSSQQDLDDAISSGVVKVNLDTDAQYAFTRALAGHVLDHWQGVIKVDGGLADKQSFDPRTWGAEAEAAMAARVCEACHQFGSASRALSIA